MPQEWIDEHGQDVEGAELEDRATELLRESGAFRRGTGIRSPRSERESRRELVPWSDWTDRRVREFYRSPCEDLDSLAQALRLTPEQKQAVGLKRIEELTFREVARVMRTRVWQVRVLLQRAEQKIRLHRHDPPVSARALFWQEIRQKQASIYRRPSKSRGFTRKELQKLLKAGLAERLEDG